MSANWYIKSLDITDALVLKKRNILYLSVLVVGGLGVLCVLLFYFIKVNNASIMAKVYILYIKKARKNAILFIRGFI